MTGACQIEVSVGNQTVVKTSVPLPTATGIISSPTPSPVPTVAKTPTALSTRISPTPSPTIAPTAAALPPKSTPLPLVPAQSQPDEIIIPAIGLTAPVTRTTWSVIQQDGQTVSVWNVPDYAAGWHVNSALPGHGSNVVLSGHHNIKGEVFRHIVELQSGDEIALRADGRIYHYTVTDRFILPERGAPPEQRLQNAQWIMPTMDERLTLVTCYPYTDNSHRVIVIAKPTISSAVAAKLP